MKKFLIAITLILSLGVYNASGDRNIGSYINDGTVAYKDSLTAPGSFTILKVVGYHPARGPYEEVAFQFDASSTANVTSVNVKVEASQDSVGWSNINELGANTSINVDETAIIIHTRVRSMKYYRATFVDETGGTDGKVVVTVRGG